MQTTALLRSTQGALHRSPLRAFGPRSALRAPPLPPSSQSASPTGSNATHHASPASRDGIVAHGGHSASGQTSVGAPSHTATSTTAASPLELGYSSASGKGRHLHEDVD